MNFDNFDKIEAQKLYDLREVTGIMSGQDLHELFNRIVGKPSPSGKLLINRESLAEDGEGFMMILKLDQPLEWALEEIKEMHDIP